MAWWIGLDDFSGTSAVESGSGKCTSTYMRKYLVRTDEGSFQSEAAVASAVGIARGAPLDTDANAICNKVTIGPGPTKTRVPFLAYFATYEFSTAATAPEDDDNDPTTTRTVWSIAPQIQSRYIIRDRNGDLIVNAAGTPFDGGIPVDVRLGSATARRNKDAAGYDKDAVLGNSGKLNSVTYLGGAPGTVQVDISAEEKYEGGYHYWAETYTFSYDPQGWQPKPVNAGFFQRASIGSDTLVRITNGDIGDTVDPDAPVQEPEPLDDDGILVPVADRPDNCTFVEVDYFGTMDFADFGL
jgi:hypothetical protein